MEKKETIKLSVRALVEFILRCGDLDSARTGAPDREAMQLGAKVHRKIQKSMGEDYQPEVTLRYEKEYDEYRLRLEGRADGIVAGEDGVLIDEIKGTNRLLEQMDGVDPLHEAQAMCYGWMYARDHDCSRVTIQITYCQLEGEDIRRFAKEYEPGELVQLAQDPERVHGRTGISISLPGRAKNHRHQCLSDHSPQQRDFCAGAYRRGQDDVRDFPCSARRGGRIGR